MSENHSKNNTQLAPMIATVVVAVMAIAAVVVLIVTMNSKSDSGAEKNSSVVQEPVFQPTQELIDECTYAAHDLVAESYNIIRLFVSEGLPHYDEPYGNKPEDGIYTVNSTEYTSLEDIEKLVNSVYTNSETERIMNMGVYKERTILVDAEYDDVTGETTGEASTAEENRPLYKEEVVLGISADFVPDSEYNKGWSACSIAVLPRSETECELTIYLGGITATSDADNDPDSVLETAMIKIDGAWKLAAFVY